MTLDQVNYHFEEILKHIEKIEFGLKIDVSSQHYYIGKDNDKTILKKMEVLKMILDI